MKKIFIAVLLLAGCTKKDTDAPPAAAEGTITVFTKSDLGAGNIDVYVDNTPAGTVSHYHTGGVTCGKGDVNIKKAAGTYTVSARAANGKTWGPFNIKLENGGCQMLELSNNGSGGSQPTATAPDTFFIADQDHTAGNYGADWSQRFTLTQSTTMVFRFASLYKAQAAIVATGQLAAFQNMQGFSGYAIFDNVFGTKIVTLPPGTYYVAVRNTANGANKWSIELDKAISLPASDRTTFYDQYLSNTKAYASGTKTWQPFTIQSGFRYFLDGCNVNTSFYVIPESELANFQNGASFNSYSNYTENGGFAPGLYEIKLPPATYYLVSRSTEASGFTYLMERWKVN